MNKTITEEWKKIDIYNSKYEISNTGKVRIPAYTDKKKRYHPEKQIKPQLIGNGYHSVCLSKNRKQKRFLVHRLVAYYFVNNPNNYEYVNHKNECLTDNCFLNLEWCSRDYNLHYGTRIERCSQARKTPVLQFSKDGKLIKIWNGVRDIEKETSFANTNISACCLRKYGHKTAYGYIWRHYDDCEFPIYLTTKTNESECVNNDTLS